MLTVYKNIGALRVFSALTNKIECKVVNWWHKCVTFSA